MGVPTDAAESRCVLWTAEGFDLPLSSLTFEKNIGR